MNQPTKKKSRQAVPNYLLNKKKLKKHGSVIFQIMVEFLKKRRQSAVIFFWGKVLLFYVQEVSVSK